MNNIVIGSRLKAEREKRGISVDEMANQASLKGLALGSEKIRSIEKGGLMHVVEWSVLLDILGLDPMDVLEDEEDTLVSLFEKHTDLTEDDKNFLEDFEMFVSALIKQEELRYN